MIDRKALSLRTKYLAILRANGVCPYCDSPLNVAVVGGAPTHFDHMEPLARGGSNEDHNIIAACAKCNGSKGTKTVFEFMCERMGIEIPLQARFDPEGKIEDWFDTDTFNVALDEDDDGSGCDPDVDLLLPELGEGLDYGDDVPMFASDEAEEGPTEPEEPAILPEREDRGWVSLDQALLGAIERSATAYGAMS